MPSCEKTIKEEDRPPQRGNIAWIRFEGVGHEQRGKRPIVVVSRNIFNHASGFCWISPITSKQKGYPFEVVIPHGVCSISGVILGDQVRTIDWRARGILFTEDSVPEDIMEDLALKQSLILNG